MTITMGQLVSYLYAAYSRQLHDERLAAVATQVHMAEMLDQAERGWRPRRTPGRRPARRTAA